MSSIKHILIDVQNLTDAQQLDLWRTLWKFADKELSPETNLLCFVVGKDKPRQGKMRMFNKFRDEWRVRFHNRRSVRKEEVYQMMQEIEENGWF